MLIQTEDTPNPSTMKFLPGCAVLGADHKGGVEIADIAEACRSPLAQTLFGIDGVQSVFFGRDFITVTRSDEKEWSALKPVILTALMEHFVGQKPVLTACCPVGEPVDDESSEVVRQIRELLDTRIRPAVAQDGGDVAFHSFEDGIVYLVLKGACAGCPSATATLKFGVERMLKHYIPEVKEVRQKRG